MLYRIFFEECLGFSLSDDALGQIAAITVLHKDEHDTGMLHHFTKPFSMSTETENVQVNVLHNVGAADIGHDLRFGHSIGVILKVSH